MNVKVKPQLLKWARNRVGLTEELLSRKLATTAEKVSVWELSGELTLARLEMLAHVAHVPFGYLFLDAPPTEALPIRDFRTMSAKNVSNPSPELIDTVNDAMRKQEWYRDYLVAEGLRPLDFVGSLAIDTPVPDAAQLVLDVLAWDDTLGPQGRTNREVLRRKTEAAEKAGIVVMHNAVVGNSSRRRLSVSEFRGFTLCDDYAPLIFLNDADSDAAKIFTLAHELVHVWIGESGVTNLDRTTAGSSAVERFCNAVAAEMLVPTKQLNAAYPVRAPTIQAVRTIAKQFKVSSLVVLRRLADLGRIDAVSFGRLYSDEVARFAQQDATSHRAGGGDFYATIRARLGRPFVAAVTASTLDGITPFRDAFGLLGVRNDEMVRRLASMTIESSL